MDNAATGFTSATEFRDFLFAGRATFTVISRKTGKHYSFDVSQVEDAPGSFFVSQVGTDRVYLGMVKSFALQAGIRETGKSKLRGSECVRAFNWLARKVDTGAIPADALVQHDGRCSRCRRALTNPLSLRTGVGPECANRLSCEKIAA